MANSLTNLADNLAEGVHKIKCKYRHAKPVELNTKIASVVLNTQALKMI